MHELGLEGFLEAVQEGRFELARVTAREPAWVTARKTGPSDGPRQR
jgi:hypothetical protein